MMFDAMPLNDLLRLANAGGGFSISDRNFDLNDLLRIANAGSDKRAILRLKLTKAYELNDLLRIASAGGGRVEFL
jgi:hypothetical protein